MDVIIFQGDSLAEVIRSIGVAGATYHPWHNEFGAPKLDQVRRLKELKLENQRPRRAVAALTVDKLILIEALSGK